MGILTSIVVGYFLVGVGFAMGRKYEHRGARYMGLSVLTWPVAIKEWLS